MAGNQLDPTRIILSIDLGSTFTRATLHSPGKQRPDNFLHITNPDWNSLRTGNYGSTEFPTHGTPFADDNRVEREAYGMTGSFSLKYLLYVLAFYEIGYHQSIYREDVWTEEAATTDEFFDAYSLIRPIRERAADKAFRKCLRNMLVKHFASIKQVVDRQATGERYHQLALAIPGNWQGALQRYYESIILDVWPAIGKENVVLVTEAEAIFHFARHELPNIDFGDRENFVTVDIGGHSMSATAFRIDPDADAMIKDWQTAAFGGSELWEHHVRVEVEQQLRENRHGDGDSEGQSTIMDLMREFRTQKQELIPAVNEVSLKTVPGESNRACVATLTKGELNMCFRHAFDNVWEKIGDLLVELDKSTLVLFSGGSIGNRAVKDRLLNITAKLGLESHFLSNGRADLCTMGVCMGAAYVAARSRSVGAAMERGAAFGIQRPDSKVGVVQLFPGRRGDTRGEVRIRLDQATRLDVICDPSFFNRVDAVGRKRLPWTKCYDFFDFDKEEHPPSFYVFSMRWDEENDQFTITRTTKGRPHGKGGSGSSGGARKPPPPKQWRLPLYVDPGQGTIFIEKDTRDVADV